MLHRRTACIAAILSVCVVFPLAGTAFGQNNTTPPPTLASFLSDPEYAGDTFTLSVNAETTYLPRNLSVQKTHSLRLTAETFGLTVSKFGSLTVVAPRTMVTLNAKPRSPQFLNAVPPDLAFMSLLASLNPGQWKALTSDSGLSLDTLTDDMQRQLFLAVLPRQNLWVQDTRDDNPLRNKTNHKDQLSAAHLRLGVATRIEFPTGTNEKPSYVSFRQPGKYYLMREGAGNDPTTYGIESRVIGANRPKASQLDYRASALRFAVPLDNVKTVQDIITLVSRTTGLELYVDPRYGNQAVSLSGIKQEVSAGDLLQALAFCLTGTFRKVGPAFILTNDLVGFGAIKYTWHNLDKEANRYLDKQRELAQRFLLSHFDETNLPTLKSVTGSLTDEQKKNSLPNSIIGLYETITTFAALTPDQKEEARFLVEHAPLDEQGNARINLNGQLKLVGYIGLEVLLPDMDSPVLYPGIAESLHLRVVVPRRQNKPNSSPDTPPAPSPPVSPETLIQVLQRFNTRAIHVRQDDVPRLSDLLPRLKQLGINQIWVDAFNNPRDATGASLQAAAKALTNSGIAIYATVAPFSWGAYSTPETADITIQGLTSESLVAMGLSLSYEESKDTRPGIVSPWSSAVQESLLVLAAKLAQNRALAGIVLVDTVPSGYHEPVTTFQDTGIPQFGYTEAARYDFLKRSFTDPTLKTRTHPDPIDIDLLYAVATQVDLNLPNFTDNTSDVEGLSVQEWKQYRNNRNEDLLRRFHKTYKSNQSKGESTSQVFVLQRDAPVNGSRFGLWSGFDTPLPDSSLAPTAPGNTTDTKPLPRIIRVRIDAGASRDTLLKRIKDAMETGTWNGILLEIDPPKKDADKDLLTLFLSAILPNSDK